MESVILFLVLFGLMSGAGLAGYALGLQIKTLVPAKVKVKRKK